MKILELTHFTEGACGVWTRAKEESLRLAKKGHEVLILSSNAVKGKREIAPSSDKIKEVRILRFPFMKIGGESFMIWRFEKKALEFAPDIIIVHNYRQPHTTAALKIARQMRRKGKSTKVFLVTHAPFVEGNITRSWRETLAVKFYDIFIGPLTINKFNKILAISKWEIKYLKGIGAKKDKIVYIPNGVPEEFFTQKKSKEENKILFLGRISIKKKLETLILALPLIKDKKIKLEIVGPKEEEYSNYIESIVKKLRLSKRVSFSKPIYNTEEKIRKIDSARLFILPSRVEGMPQSLIEAMARERVVIGSNSLAIRDLIKDKKNGYLFEFDDPENLAKVIDLVLSEEQKKIKEIKKCARKGVEDFNWSKIIEKIGAIIGG